MRRLFGLLALAVVGCQPHHKPASFVHCYALHWQGSNWPSLPPESIRLAVTFDSGTLPPPEVAYPIMPVRSADSTMVNWKQLTRAAWYSIPPDSLVLAFSTARGNWSAYVVLLSDSLVGTTFYGDIDSDGAGTPSPFVALETPCP